MNKMRECVPWNQITSSSSTSSNNRDGINTKAVDIRNSKWNFIINLCLCFIFPLTFSLMVSSCYFVLLRSFSFFFRLQLGWVLVFVYLFKKNGVFIDLMPSHCMSFLSRQKRHYPQVDSFCYKLLSSWFLSCFSAIFSISLSSSLALSISRLFNNHVDDNRYFCCIGVHIYKYKNNTRRWIDIIYIIIQLKFKWRRVPSKQECKREREKLTREKKAACK